MQDDFGLTLPNDEDLADFGQVLIDWVSATGSGQLEPVL